MKTAWFRNRMGAYPPEAVISIDVEWACPEVLADVVGLLNERNLRATFFCTHAGIEVPGHERSIHPNFQRSGNTQLTCPPDPGNELEFCRATVRAVKEFCPEGIGARSHRRHTSALVEQVFTESGLQYDSTSMLPLTVGLAPAWISKQLVALPIYYMDHWDLVNDATDFDLRALRLEDPGLKILDFHPNLIYMNARSLQHYEDNRGLYHDPGRLKKIRHPGRGVRTLFLEVLDALACAPRRTLADINLAWRTSPGVDVESTWMRRDPGRSGSGHTGSGVVQRGSGRKVTR